MGKHGKIGDGIVRLDPHALLFGILEVCVVTLDFTAHGIDFPEGDAGAINGRSIIIRNGDIFGEDAFYLVLVLIFRFRSWYMEVQ